MPILIAPPMEHWLHNRWCEVKLFFLTDVSGERALGLGGDCVLRGCLFDIAWAAGKGAGPVIWVSSPQVDAVRDRGWPARNVMGHCASLTTLLLYRMLATSARVRTVDDWSIKSRAQQVRPAPTGF